LLVFLSISEAVKLNQTNTKLEIAILYKTKKC